MFCAFGAENQRGDRKAQTHRPSYTKQPTLKKICANLRNLRIKNVCYQLVTAYAGNRSPIDTRCLCGRFDCPTTEMSSPRHLSAESANDDSPGQSDAEGGASPWVKRRLCSCSSAPLAPVGKADWGQRGNGTHARCSPSLRPAPHGVF
jgi:hypothetical protein